jgi:site-specific recombinase XerD
VTSCSSSRRTRSRARGTARRIVGSDLLAVGGLVRLLRAFRELALVDPTSQQEFVNYLEQRDIDTITTENALAWATLPAGTSLHWLAIRVSVVRGFAAYLHSLDPTVEVPPAGVIHAVGPCRATPYLYSEAEIRSLIQAAAILRPHLRAATYQSLISLLAVSGLRISEAIALDDEDLDVEHELLVVRDTKFGKHRLVPLHPSAMRALTRYRQFRRERLPRLASPALLLSSRGTRLLHSNISLVFARLADRCGITRRSASCTTTSTINVRPGRGCVCNRSRWAMAWYTRA